MKDLKLEDSEIIEIETGRQVDYDGNPATPEQIREHKAIRERNNEAVEKFKTQLQKERALSHKAFVEKYREGIEEFYGWLYEDNEKDGSGIDYEGLNIDHLINNLATTLFDAQGSGRGTDEDVMYKIKKYFPDIYVEVLEAYATGQHDT